MENNTKLPENPEKKDKQRIAGMALMEAGIEFAVAIALPLLFFIYLGKKLDARYSSHFYVIIGIFLALGLSSYIIYLKIKSIKDLLK